MDACRRERGTKLFQLCTHKMRLVGLVRRADSPHVDILDLY